MPTERLQIYRCPVCESLVEVLDPCGVELVCCGPQMVPMRERVEPDGRGDHSLIVDHRRDGVAVVVGASYHPMEKDHHIQWIELITAGRCYRQFLNPGDAPEAFFHAPSQSIAARCFCRLHGLWRWRGTRPMEILKHKSNFAEASA